MDSTVLSVASRAVVDAVGALGLDADALVASCQIDPSILTDPDARIPAEKADLLWQNAYATSNDPLLSLHAAERLPFGAYRVLDYLVSTSATIGEGLGAVADYFPLVDARAILTEKKIGNRVHLTFESADNRFSLPAPAQEYTLAALLLRSREGTGVSWKPAAIHFTFSAPEDPSEFERIFQCPLGFDQKKAALVVPNSVWRSATQGADASLHAVLAQHARMLFEKHPLADSSESSSIVEQVKDHISTQLRNGLPTMEAVAKSMGMSSKTLQRRLKDSQTVFANVADEVRLHHAKRYLCDGAIALAEVSWLLGFSEQSAFTRAFKRWTGQSPAKWRSAILT